MKSNLKRIILTGILLLCCFLYGCEKADSEAAIAEEETGSTEITATCIPENVSNITVTPVPVQQSEDNINSENGEEVMNKVLSSSWKQIKEIKPKEKGIRSRFTGFYNDNFGISTFQYGVLNYTVDGGETWKSGINTSNCIAGLEIIDDKNAVITANYSEVRVSDDGGLNWKEVPKFGDMKNEHCRFASFIDKSNGWIANKKEVGCTTDGGQTFVGLSVPQNLTEICAIWLSSATEGYILSSDGKLYVTSDGGATWTEKDLGIKGLRVMVCPATALHVEDQQSFQIVAYLESESERGYYYLTTSDGGSSWVKNELIAEGGPGYIYLSRDGEFLTISDDKDKTIRVYQFVP